MCVDNCANWKSYIFLLDTEESLDNEDTLNQRISNIAVYIIMNYELKFYVDVINELYNSIIVTILCFIQEKSGIPYITSTNV